LHPLYPLFFFSSHVPPSTLFQESISPELTSFPLSAAESVVLDTSTTAQKLTSEGREGKRSDSIAYSMQRTKKKDVWLLSPLLL